MDLYTRLVELTDRAQARWEALDYAAEAFPALATELLEEAALHEHAELSELLDVVVDLEPLPPQVDPHNSFGDPPVTLCMRERFALDVYFWHQPTVAIHNHSFHGAFTVFHGLSLHTTFAFEEQESYEDRQILVGEIPLVGMELLQRGAVRPIGGGMDFIHQVAHLSSPCCSIVLRTSGTTTGVPIYNFLPPHLGVLQQGMDIESTKRVAILGLLGRMAPEEADARIARVLERCPARVVVQALRLMAQQTQDLDRVNALARGLKERPWMEAFLTSMAHTDRSFVQWDAFTSEGPRLFSLLVQNTNDRALRDSVVDTFRPTKTFAEAVVGWTQEMAGQGMFGVELPPVTLFILKGMVEGKPGATIAQELAGYGAAADGLEEHVEGTRAFFERHALFRHLFAGL